MSVVVCLAVAACSGGDDSATELATATTEVASTTSAVAAVDPEPDTSTTVPPVATSVDTPSVPGSSATLETIATVPEEGVPGIDSENAFCRGWGEFAGSFQALALVASFETDPVAAARLEVIAAAAVISAAQDLADALPDEVDFERDEFVDGVIGPFARRATRALDELGVAGLSSTEFDQLGDVWLAALTDAGVDDPEIVVVVPVDLASRVDVATAGFVAEVPRIVDDPSLITAASAPTTFNYLAENCPDQGILGGNDAID